MTIKKTPPKKKTVKKKAARKKASVTKLPVRRKAAPRKRKSPLVRQLSPLVNDIVGFAESHKVPEGHMVGQPLVLMDWQVDWIIATFQPHIRVSLLSVARRGGKTALIAVIVAAGLYGPLVVANSLLLSSSRSKEQASLVYKYIFNMARLSGYDHLLTFRASVKEIFCPQYGIEYKAVSADGKKQHGKSANILVTDELGQVRGPYDELYETLSSGQGSYLEPKHLIISTRAPNDGDLFNILIDDALTGEDPTTAVAVYAADDDCDLLDEAQWLKANPSLPYGVRDMGDLRRQALQASRIPSKEASFRNLILNQKVDSAASFITAGVWKRGARPVNEELFTNPDIYVYGGLDLSARRDITSLVLSVEDPKTGEVNIKVYAWIPEEGLREKAKTDHVPYDVWVAQGYLIAVPGNSIHYDHVAPDIAEIVAEYDVLEVNFDRWRIDQLQHELDKIGASVNLVPMGQGYRDFDGAVNETESLLLDELLVHGGNPILTNHISNVVITTDPTNARKMDKGKAINKIDCAVAMAMAIAGVKRTRGDEGGGSGIYGSDESAKNAVI
jgi:phage terminase large subunit-like protein